MPDLKTTYMGLELRNPIIAGSSGKTNSLESIKELEKAGVGAVVLKSIFEEQILLEADHEINETGFHPEAADYFDAYVKENHLSEFIKLIRMSKEQTEIPIIASINCNTSGEWINFAQKLEKAGADALELNYFVLPSSLKLTAQQVEDNLFAIIEKVTRTVNIPVSVKISSYFSNFAKILDRLGVSGVKGVVLFNRFYNPDINIETLKLSSGHPFSSPEDHYHTLRWMAIASDFVECDLAASTGIHDGKAAVKQILAGASAVQMVSALYLNDFSIISDTVKFIENWMDEHKFSSIDDFKGKLKQGKESNHAFFERVQFMKYYGGHV